MLRKCWFFAIVLVVFASEVREVLTVDWHRVLIDHFTNTRQNRLMSGGSNSTTKTGLLTSKKLNVKIVNSGGGNDLDNELSNELTQNTYYKPPAKPPQSQQPQQPNNEQLIVSETLLYVVDSLQTLANRYRALDERIAALESLHFNVTCARNYTRHGRHCYRFVRSFKRTWDSAHKDCNQFNGAGAHLLALDSLPKAQQVIELILNDNSLKGKTFWLNGLNANVQWIWTHSAQPIKVPAIGPVDVADATFIPGDGNCLTLSYDRRNAVYEMRGTKCNFLSFYICEQSFGNI